MCLPQAGFVAKYDQKLTTLGGILGCWQPQARSCMAAKNAELGFLAVWTERNGAFWMRQE